MTRDEIIRRLREITEDRDNKLRELQAAPQWQPIETAPRDGEAVATLLDRVAALEEQVGQHRVLQGIYERRITRLEDSLSALKEKVRGIELNLGENLGDNIRRAFKMLRLLPDGRFEVTEEARAHMKEVG